MDQTLGHLLLAALRKGNVPLASAPRPAEVPAPANDNAPSTTSAVTPPAA